MEIATAAEGMSNMSIDGASDFRSSLNTAHAYPESLGLTPIAGSHAHGSPPKLRESYQVGIICALDIEFEAILAMLDEEHPSLNKAAGDGNIYAFGRIHRENVVLACASTGTAGSVTVVAKDMMRSFPLKVGLLVGLCDGVWSEETDIRLGDVIVSQPTMHHGGVVQWDFDIFLRKSVFKHTGMLHKPPDLLFEAVRRLKTLHPGRGLDMIQPIAELLRKRPEWINLSEDRCVDKLFASDYHHEGGYNCDNCDKSRVVTRKPVRDREDPRIHYGNIASSTHVPLDAQERDRIAHEQGILCFETEAAGLMNSFPCVMIRGVCGYGDSHKNDSWQAYAAGTAACYAKDLMKAISDPHIDNSGYQDLDQTRHETRFLRVHHPSYDAYGRISCTMSIGSPLENIEYVALSYCWGDPDLTDCVLVNCRQRQVTRNLKVALSELRKRSVTTIWIDALCIDQNNLNEKVYQLSRMDSIYSQASKVIVWLGTAADDSDLAMQILMDGGRHSPVSVRGTRSLVTLFERDYWRRAWIIQEVAKASNVEVWCGSRIVPWQNLIAAVDKLLTPVPHHLVILKNFCEAERAVVRGKTRMLLSTAMVLTMHTEASFQRDKLYALIGLSRDGRTIIPTPNYEQPETEVFNAALKHMIITQGRLDLVFFVGTWNAGGSSPSWLPPWYETWWRPWPNDPPFNWLPNCFVGEPKFPSNNCVVWDQESKVLNVDAQIIGTIGSHSEATAQGQQDHEQAYVEEFLRGRDVAPISFEPYLATLFVVCTRALSCRAGWKNVPVEALFNVRQITALMDVWLASEQPYPGLLSQWFHKNSTVSYRGVSIQDVVEWWTSHQDVRIVCKDKTDNGHDDSDAEFSGDGRELLPSSLEDALQALSVRGMELIQAMDKLPFIVAHRETQPGDYVVWLRQTSLLAVLHPESRGRFSVVGEVVDTPERLGLTDHGLDNTPTPWTRISLV